MAEETKNPASGPVLEVVKAGGIDFPPKLFALITLFAVTDSAVINIMMASRLCYGMANERILPRVMGRVLPHRRTPVVGIVFVSLLAIGLVSTGDRRPRRHHGLPAPVRLHRVNIAVLVLRRDRVEHQHFSTPTALPVLGAITALILAGPLSDRPAAVYIRAGVLLAIGIGLWALNKLVMKVRGEA